MKAPGGPSTSGATSRGQVVCEVGVPFCAQTLTLTRVLAPAAYDWAEAVFVRDGTGMVAHRAGRPEPVRAGGVVVLRRVRH
jgi:hypothetical protein